VKIIGIEPIPIVVPLKIGMTTRTTLGDHVVSPYVIIKIYTDEGIVGLGEATFAAKWSGETSAGCIGAIKSILEINDCFSDINVLCVTPGKQSIFA